MGNEKSKGTFYSSAANKKYMNSKKKYINKNKNNTASPIKLNSFRFYPINGKTITMNTTARYLPPRDVIYNLALDYLEIYDINNLAQSCKLIYYWLFCDHDPKNGFWKRIARRDQFSQFKEELSDDDCRKMYWKLSTCRLVFEKDLYFLESQYYSMSNIRSESHIKFREFVKAIDNDFGQLKYILRNRRRNILTRAYVTVYGLDGSWEDSFYYEKKDELAKLAMEVEDGTMFPTHMEWTGPNTSNITCSVFSDPYFRDNIEWDKHFVFNVAFRTNYTLESSSTFVFSAVLFLETRFSSYDCDIEEFYRLFCSVLRNPEKRNLFQKEDLLKRFIGLFLRYKGEEVVEIVLNLLQCTDECERSSIDSITFSALQESQHVHPLLLEGLLKEQFYSNNACHDSYLMVIGKYVSTTDSKIDLPLREKALSHMENLWNNKLNQNVRDPFLYYKPWSAMKSKAYFPFPEFKEQALSKLKDWTLECVKDDLIIYYLGIIIEMAENDLKKTAETLLSITQFPSVPSTIVRIWIEIFRIWERYSKLLESNELEPFFSRLVEILHQCCQQPMYQQNSEMLDLIEKTLKWIAPKYQKIETIETELHSIKSELSKLK